MNIPADVRDKINRYALTEQNGKVEVQVLFGTNEKLVEEQVSALGGEFINLGFGFGIITVDVNLLADVLNIKGIIYMELPEILYTSYLPSNRASCIPEVWSRYNLTGKGTLIGFIDSGIDYQHPAFRTEDGGTRIEYIKDFSLEGKVWNKQEINEALKSQDPTKIIPHMDFAGHGTHVAGIACAGGKIDRRNYGVAYESSIMMVKMAQSGKITYAKSTQVMEAIKFLIDKSKELDMPLVINLSFSTNEGAHNGGSILEQYIAQVSTLERLSFVVSAGNEGDSAHHVGGILRGKQSFGFNIGGQERNVSIQLYKSVLKEIQIEIKNPIGQTTDVITIEEGYRQGRLGNDSYILYDSGPKPFNIQGEIVISIVSRSNFITSGVWEFIIYSDNKVGVYNMWLPITEGLNPETRFTKPNPYNTLGIPATVKSVIAVGSYDYLNNTFSPFSGRGSLMGCTNKPDLVAPGQGIQSSIPGGGYDSLTGTSMSAPFVSGSCSLLMQWGIVMKNDIYMYGDRLKYILIRGARRDRVDVNYPSPEWGYGSLCLNGSFNIIEQGFRSCSLIEENKDVYSKKLKRDNKVNRPSNKTIVGQIKGLKKDGGNKLDFSDMNSKQIDSSNFENNGNSNSNNTNPENVSCGSIYAKENTINLIVEYQGDIQQAFENIKDSCAFILDENYAVISVPISRYEEIIKIVPEVVFVEPISLFSLTAASPLESAQILQFHENAFLKLTGKGVIFGAIDTGIDYLNEEFMYEDDTTRILELWDQTSRDNESNSEFGFGYIYSSEKINEAIQAKKQGKDPYKIVDSKDVIGHGTSLAGIVAARGRKDEFVGAAPDSEIIMVKLAQSKQSVLDITRVHEHKGPIYESTDLILGLKYLLNCAKKYRKPMAIFIPLGSNWGGHSGTTILERYIDHFSDSRGVVVVTGTGNQADADIHVEGNLNNEERSYTIELRVDDDQKDLNFQIWFNKPDKVSLSIVSPSGEVISKIPAKLKQTEEIDFVFEGTKMFVDYYIPEEVTGDELILIRSIGIKGGIWQFKLNGDFIINGNFDAWLPQRELLKDGTRFINASPYKTLMIPSTARKALVASEYNQNNNSIVISSGRGFTRDGRIKPDLAAGGVDVQTLSVKGGYTIVNGSSPASAVLCGAAILLLQWGIVDGKDPTLSAAKMNTYLIRGANRREGDIYPNRQWGYGTLDLIGVFNNIRSLDAVINRRKKDLFFRIPKEIKRCLNIK